MRTAFLATIAAFAVTLVVAALTLPDRVAMHFDGSGQVDRWAERPVAVLTMGLVGAGLALLFLGLGRASTRMSDTFINVPGKAWWMATPEREQVLRHRLREDLYLFGAMTMVLLVGIVIVTLRVSRAGETVASTWNFAIVGVYLVAVTGWSIYTKRVRYRPGGAG